MLQKHKNIFCARGEQSAIWRQHKNTTAFRFNVPLTPFKAAEVLSTLCTYYGFHSKSTILTSTFLTGYSTAGSTSTEPWMRWPPHSAYKGILALMGGGTYAYLHFNNCEASWRPLWAVIALVRFKQRRRVSYVLHFFSIPSFPVISLCSDIKCRQRKNAANANIKRKEQCIFSLFDPFRDLNKKS